jgi:type IV secretion system protein TrbI
MSRHPTRVRAGNDRASLYTEITDKIIAELEAGRIPWVQPWGTAAIKAPLAMPRNAASQRGYSGINVLILWGAVVEHGFSGQSWLTFRQALGLGGHVRKGERGTTVVYADRFTPDDERRRAADAGEEPGAIPFLKRFTVFNTHQCDGLPEEVAASVVPPPPGQIEPRAEALIAQPVRISASTGIREVAASIAQAAGHSAMAVPNPTSQLTQPTSDDTFTQNGQDRKLAFVNASVDRRTTSADRVAAPASSYVVQAGNIIPASLITGIRSDLPGQITAQVTENVYDSRTGRFLLIPQGTRLIGIYDSQVAFGQSRVLLVWTRLIMPNGRGIVLERQPGADASGYAGLEDQVDNHWGALFKAALLSTLLGVGSELGSTTGTGSNSDVLTALRRGSSDSLNQTGQKVVQRNLNIQPTLTIRPGFPVRVIVNRDLVLEPYRG